MQMNIRYQRTQNVRYRNLDLNNSADIRFKFTGIYTFIHSTMALFIHVFIRLLQVISSIAFLWLLELI